MYDGKHTIWVIFFIAIFSLSVAVNFNTTAEAQTQKTLTNDDIVSLVKAGLSEEAIITMIQKSQTKFDLTPDALIELKKAGVSNKVIETMVGGTSLNVGDSKTPLIPTAYGYYVIDEGQLLELKPTPVITKMGLQIGGRSGMGYAMDGFAGETSLSLRSYSPIFIVYQQNVDIRTFRLSDLVYVETKQAYQFNIKGTDSRFFRNVYSRNENDVIQIDLWRPKTKVPLRVEPVEGKPGMYKVIPEALLRPGRYTLYIEGDINPDGTVFAAEINRKSSAFYFRIGE